MAFNRRKSSTKRKLKCRATGDPVVLLHILHKVFVKTAPEAPSSFTNVENGRTSDTGYAVHKIIGLASNRFTRQSNNLVLTAYPVIDVLPFFALVKRDGASGVVLVNTYKV